MKTRAAAPPAAASAAVPLRVLLVDLASRFGGPETRVLSQAAILQGRVEHCAVAVTRGSPLHQRLVEEGIPCEPVAAGRADPRLLLELRRVIRRGRFDVVDAHNIQSIFWGHLAALVAGARGRITTVHSDYGEEYTGIRRAFYPAVFRLVRPITRHFVQVTEALQEQAQRRGQAHVSTFIPNAVSVPEDPATLRDPALRTEWGWNDTDFVVAVIGRLFSVKGQIHAIEALAELSDLPQVKLLLVGDGPMRAELEIRTAQLRLGDRVRFLGFRSDVPRLLAAVDCVCLPSLWELLPYAALEGAAYARPIVASAVGGVPRLLRNEETALLVPPGDPLALAGALRSIATDPHGAARLGMAAYEMVRDCFSTRELLRKTLEVYQQALA